MLTFAGTYVMKLVLRWGWGWGGVGWGMLTFAGTYVMKLMLRWGWGWGGVGHVNIRKIKGLLGSKVHPGIPDLVHLWLYRSWHGSDPPACVYKHLTHLWKQR